MFHKTLAASLCSMALGLSACGGAADKNADQSSSATWTGSAAGYASTVDPTKQYNLYIKAHNDLLGMFYGGTTGMEDLLADYSAQKLDSNASQFDINREPILYLNTSILRNSLDALRQAQAQPAGGDYAKLEAIGAKMLQNGDALLKQGNDLDAYFKAKKYTEDNMAKGKAENAAFIQRWTQFIADADALGAELNALERRGRADEIKQFEQDGNHRAALRVQALGAANDLISLFEDGADVKNAENMKQADELAKSLEQALTQLKTESDKVQDEDSYRYTRAYDALNVFLGHWRTFKATQDDEAFNDMVEQYNNAID